jgi:hypothetical protein
VIATRTSPSLRLLFGGLAIMVVAGGGIYYAATRQSPEKLPAPPPTAQLAPAPVAALAPSLPPSPEARPSTPERAKVTLKTTQEPDTSSAPKSPYARITIKAGEPIPELFPHEKEREQLYALAASYDPKQIPTIAASLAHPDAEVREAARLALVQLGSAQASPHLRRAAAQTTDADEKARLLESASFLDLPTFPPATGNPSSPLPSQPEAPWDDKAVKGIFPNLNP